MRKNSITIKQSNNNLEIISPIIELDFSNENNDELKFRDIVITGENNCQFYFFKHILHKCSNKFCPMLLNFKEGIENNIQLGEVHPDLLNKLLNIIYYWYRNDLRIYNNIKTSEEFVNIFDIVNMHLMTDIKVQLIKFYSNSKLPFVIELIKFYNENDTLFDSCMNKKLYDTLFKHKQKIDLKKIPLNLHVELLKYTKENSYLEIWNSYVFTLSYEDIKKIFDKVKTQKIEWIKEEKINYSNFFNTIINWRDSDNSFETYTLYFTYVYEYLNTE